MPQSDTTTAAASAVHDDEGDNVLTVDKLINGDVDACIVYSLRSATNMPRLVTKSSATAEIARDADDAPQGRFVTERLGDAMINLPTKFEMPNFIRYGNMKGVANCRKWVVRVGWGHPSLSAMSPFDRAHTTSYSSVPFMRYSLRQVQNRSILLRLLCLTLPAEGFPWDDSRKILHKGQRMAKVHSGEKILPKASTLE